MSSLASAYSLCTWELVSLSVKVHEPRPECQDARRTGPHWLKLAGKEEWGHSKQVDQRKGRKNHAKKTK